MGLVLGQSWMVVPISNVLLCASSVKEFVVIVYKNFNPYCTFFYQSLGVCEVSDVLYLRG